MKKSILLPLVIAFTLLALSACGNNENVQGNTEEGGGENRAEIFEDYEDEAINMEDEYEIVDSINIDTPEVSVKYTGYEIIDGTDEDGNAKKQLVVYCDFTNKTSNATSSASAISTQSFQNGIEMQGWGGSEYNDSLKNEMTDIMDGATLNVGYLFDLHDTENPVKFRISNSLNWDMYDSFAQQQEILLQ